jgi:hypothetical protein
MQIQLAAGVAQPLHLHRPPVHRDLAAVWVGLLPQLGRPPVDRDLPLADQFLAGAVRSGACVRSFNRLYRGQKDPATLARVNRPDPVVKLERIVAGLKGIPGLVVQSVLVDGAVTDVECPPDALNPRSPPAPRPPVPRAAGGWPGGPSSSPGPPGSGRDIAGGSLS